MRTGQPDQKRGKIPLEKLILTATMETIEDNKISGTRLREIAKRAGISQGHMHYYYPSKDELLLHLLDYLEEVFIEERKGVMADQSISPEEKLHVFLEQEIYLIHHGQEMKVFLDYWVQGTANAVIRAKIGKMYARWRADIRTVIDSGVQAGVFKPQNAAIVPAILSSMMDGASLQYMMDENALDLQDYFNTVYTIILHLLKSS
jgi:AcrR family transcriptional regulator